MSTDSNPNDMPVQPGYTRLEITGVAMLTILAAGLFFYRIGRTCLWFDEGYSWYFARDYHAMWGMLRAREANMWLYYVFLSGWMRMFGDGLVAMRALSALAATACVPVLYVTARRLMPRRAAVAAVLLLAFSPYMLRYAQEARSYSMLCLTSAIGTLLFVQIYFYGRTKWWPLYAVVSAAGVWLHFHGVFFPAAHVLFYCVCPRRFKMWKPLIGAWLLFFALIVPIPFLQPLQSGQIHHLSTPGLVSLLKLASNMQGGVIALGCLMVWLGVAACAELWRRRSGQPASGLRGILPFLLISVISPVVAVFAVSVALKPVWEVRYFTFLIPAYALLIPAILDRLPVKPWLFGIAVSSLLIAQASTFPREYRRQNPRWDNAVSLLAKQAGSHDGVLLGDPGYRGCFLHAGLAFPGVPPLVVKDNRKEISIKWIMGDEKRISILRKRYPRLWVVETAAKTTNWPEVNRLFERLETGYDRKARVDFGEIRVFLFVGKAMPLLPLRGSPAGGSEPAE